MYKHLLKSILLQFEFEIPQGRALPDRRKIHHRCDFRFLRPPAKVALVELNQNARSPTKNKSISVQANPELLKDP
jgi:hypothetical protein